MTKNTLLIVANPLLLMTPSIDNEGIGPPLLPSRNKGSHNSWARAIYSQLSDTLVGVALCFMLYIAMSIATVAVNGVAVNYMMLYRLLLMPSYQQNADINVATSTTMMMLTIL